MKVENMKDNLALWNKVKTTDPKHTKKVEFDRKFTAIDAMYQIQTATEQFGAAGEGWGWSFGEPIFPINGTVVIKCTLWHGTKDNTVEQFGQKKLGDSSRPDEDAFKKAATDGLTKCLSLLGFNADVFLGKFDDNKYVENLKKNNVEGGVLDTEARDETKHAFIKDVNERLNKTTNLKELDNALTKEQTAYLKDKLSKIDPIAYQNIKNRFAELNVAFKKIAEAKLLETWNNA